MSRCDVDSATNKLIHPTAIVDSTARLHPTVRLGPYAVVGAGARLGPDCVLGPHAVVQGDTVLGEANRLEAHVVLGGEPQVRDLDGGGGRLELGRGNWLREFTTVHRARPGGVTRIGDNTMLMAYSHVAHDCTVGDNVELANAVQLAGHVQLGDHARVGGMAAVHQFVRVGARAFVGGGAMVSRDVPPYALVSGDRARCYGLNAVGLRRQGVDPERRAELALALRLLLTATTLAQGAAKARQQVPRSAERELLLCFALESSRGLCALAVGAEGDALTDPGREAGADHSV